MIANHLGQTWDNLGQFNLLTGLCNFLHVLCGLWLTYNDTKCCDKIDIELGSGTLVLLQQILYLTYAMIEHVDVIQVFHHLCHNTIPIVVHMREVLWASLTIQTSWIHDFYMIVILIESGRHIRLIVTMHHGIHHQLTQHLIGIVLHVFFSQDTNGNRPLSHDAIADEVLQQWQYLV